MARLLLALVAAACMLATASALDENMNFRAPVVELPSLATPLPAEFSDQISAGRSLLHDGSRSKEPSAAPWKRKQSDGGKRRTKVVFGQGVASGDPFPKSVILWARVTPPSDKRNKAAAVDWAVSKTRDFEKVVRRGTTFTSSDVDFTVKVEAKRLQPNTQYWYQFRYRENRETTIYSPLGRTRTTPLADDDIARARIAFFGCSNLPQGFFTAYGQIARDAAAGKIDYNIHTGDYIYEYANDYNVNAPSAFLTSPDDKAARAHRPAREIVSLADYRERHNQYNSDVDTQAMRGSAPLIPVWDDHEYTNDAWRNGAQNHQPATEGDWDSRRLRALQVYYEQMPIRQANADDKQRIYRNFEIGKLIKLIMLDTRVIGRDQQNTTDRFNPARTLLGANQKKYLLDQLSEAKAAHTWKVIGQQVLFIHSCRLLTNDQWDGYSQDRMDILDHLENNKIDNTIVLTGDIHSHWANDVPKYPCVNETGFNYDPATGKGSLAVEFVSSSITSDYNTTDAKRAASLASRASLAAINPHVKYFESFYKGYAILDVTRKQAVSSWYYAPDLSRFGQYETKLEGEKWKVVAGENRIQRA